MMDVNDLCVGGMKDACCGIVSIGAGVLATFVVAGGDSFSTADGMGEFPLGVSAAQTTPQMIIAQIARRPIRTHLSH